MKVFSKTVILVFILSLSSCYTRYSTNLLQERKNLPQYTQADFENYRLQPNDELVIRVITTNESLRYMFPSSSNAQNVYSYKVYEDGTVDFPYISRVPLASKTIKEAELIVRDRLREFADDVEVKLGLKTQSYCVIGEAGRGYFPIYKERLTIFQALALAGGINEGALLSKVKIIRTTDNGTIIKSFDIRTKSIVDSEFYYIQPNDIIYLDVSKKKFWASSNFVQFMSLITSSITLFVLVLTVK